MQQRPELSVEFVLDRNRTDINSGYYDAEAKTLTVTNGEIFLAVSVDFGPQSRRISRDHLFAMARDAGVRLEAFPEPPKHSKWGERGLPPPDKVPVAAQPIGMFSISHLKHTIDYLDSIGTDEVQILASTDLMSVVKLDARGRRGEAANATIAGLKRTRLATPRPMAQNNAVAPTPEPPPAGVEKLQDAPPGIPRSRLTTWLNYAEVVRTHRQSGETDTFKVKLRRLQQCLRRLPEDEQKLMADYINLQELLLEQTANE